MGGDGTEILSRADLYYKTYKLHSLALYTLVFLENIKRHTAVKQMHSNNSVESPVYSLNS